MNFKKKLTIGIIYALIVSLTVIAGLKVSSFITKPFETVEEFIAEEVEETAGRSRGRRRIKN